VQIAGDALLDLRHAPLHLVLGEVLVAVVHGLELAADFKRWLEANESYGNPKGLSDRRGTSDADEAFVDG
jgi:hypothetical protein